MTRGLPGLFTILLGMSAVIPSLVTAQRDSRAPLELVNKGYENLLIGISERVPADPALLDRIKFVFEEASRFLYAATNNRAYFKDVHILVPESWPDSDEYANIVWQRYDQSDVRIDTPSEATAGNRPYVNKKTPCGEPGDFIHLTPDYLLSQSVASRYGPYDKTLVHEWAHYRWGVFDEYPLGNDQHFYADSEGNIQAVRCVLKIQGRRFNPRKNTGCEVDENGVPESDCRFLDDSSASDYTGSLMYKQFLPAISTFCERNGNDVDAKNEHNRDAPNMQNRQCNGKSIWEVMLQHRDFAPAKGDNDVNGGGNSNRGSSAFDGEPVPTFTIVKKRSSRLVLVLDKSGSMEGQRLTRLRQAAECLISTILKDGEQLGIVEFDKTAIISSNLLTINDANRQTLLRRIPDVANGATSIGAGIESGLDVLSAGDMSPDGGKLLVITDGEENRNPYIEEVLPLVNVSGVTVDTIALGLEASPHLELLSSLTGGISFAYISETNSLCDALTRSSTIDKDITSTPVNVYSELVKIPTGQTFTDVVFLDNTIGRDTQFVFDANNVGRASVRLTDPDGKVLTEGSPEYGILPSYERIRIIIADNAKVGVWTFEVSNRLESQQEVRIQVVSHAREAGKDPITIKSQWGYAAVVPPQKQSLYVTVGQGYIPVLDGDVKAVVELPCGVGNQTVDLYPKDDGAGADVIKGDGVYSAYFTEFCSQGRYGVNVRVNNNMGGTTSVAFGSVVGTGSAPNPEYTGDDDEFQPAPTLRSTGEFSRVTIGGSFKCEGSNVCNGSVDLYPPSRITDLRASSLDTTTMQVTLSFTAPGDDLTTGRASRYIIVMSRNVADIYDNFEAVSEIPPSSFVEGDVMMTKETGETEVFVVKVPEIGHFSYSFAVVAVDNEDNRSEPSNVATTSARNFKALGVGAIVGLAIGCALLLFVVTVLVVFLIRRVKSKKGKDDDPLRTNKALDQNNVDPENVYANIGNEMSNKAGNVITRHPKTVNSGRPSSGPEINHGFIGGGQIDTGSPVYDECISRRDMDPNWDPTLPNNREGGGAHIKPGHVADARAKFDKIGVLK